MALNDEVLKNFFTKTKKSLPSSPRSQEDGSQLISIPHYRVFDDPIIKENDLAVQIKNLGQSQDKVRTNLGQSQDKVRTNLGQSQDKLRTKSGQSQDKLRTQPRTKLRTKSGQSQDNLQALCSFPSLIGLQRKIILLIYEICKISRSRITSPISMEHLANSCQTTKFSVHKTIQRLENKKIILRNNFKNGRGGWTQYELSDAIFQEIMHEETQSKLRTNSGQSQDKLRTQPRTELRTNLSSSSSYINNKTTTTREVDGEFKKLPDEWLAISIDSLLEIGFTTAHLAQISQQGKLSAEIVQDSIHAFAFDLKYNNKGATIKGSALNYFMGIIRNGKPYAPPSNYESPQDREIRIYLERKQKIENVRAAREEELMKLAFDEWEREQSEENKQALFPEDLRSNRFLAPKQAFLRTYFAKEIWPNKRQEIEKEIQQNLRDKK